MPEVGPAPPPPPPVLPPLPSAKKGDDTTPEEVGQLKTKHVSVEEFTGEIREWVDNFWGRGEDDVDEVVLVVAVPLKTVLLQNGPMCGIIALAEGLEILNSRTSLAKHGNVCPKTVLDEAIRRGYTKQGEMFSVEALQSLAEKFGTGSNLSRIVRISQKASSETFADIVHQLVSGYPVLVPYDKDGNNAPGLRKGHSAHWAVIHGLLCSIPYQSLASILSLDNPDTSTLSEFQVLYSSRKLVILSPSAKSTAQESKLVAELFMANNSYTHVISHQGKSLRTAVWKYTDLIASNQNLKEISPKIMANKEDYILHEGIEDGLGSKILLLR